MHHIDIPAAIVARVIARHGREHVFWDLDPSRTALVVVDLQNAFMLPGVAHVLCPEAVDIVPNVNLLAAALRETGGAVVWVQTDFGGDILDRWWVQKEMSGAERTAQRRQALTPGSIGHALWSGLDARPDDLYATKTRYSAFVDDAPNLETMLRGRGIDTIIVVGCLTNVCCESTARDAQMRNFRVVFVSDANAATTDADHNNSLCAVWLNFGDVMPTAMVIERLRAGAK